MDVIKEQNGLFSVLYTTESTNNYAVAQVHAGLAMPGQAWFALAQTAGKGQRGKTWQTAPGENIILSIAIRQVKVFEAVPFLISVLTANICRLFFEEQAGEEIKIKWPNDIYWRDRKTGGILIENIYKGQEWEWSIIGIGININQIEFDLGAGNAASLKQITGKESDPVLLAKGLHQMLIEKIAAVTLEATQELLIEYNTHLYKKNEIVRLKKESAVFETEITGVDEYGQLITKDVMENAFEVGEVMLMIE